MSKYEAKDILWEAQEISSYTCAAQSQEMFRSLLRTQLFDTQESHQMQSTGTDHGQEAHGVNNALTLQAKLDQNALDFRSSVIMQGATKENVSIISNLNDNQPDISLINTHKLQ